MSDFNFTFASYLNILRTFMTSYQFVTFAYACDSDDLYTLTIRHHSILKTRGHWWYHRELQTHS